MPVKVHLGFAVRGDGEDSRLMLLVVRERVARMIAPPFLGRAQASSQPDASWRLCGRLVPNKAA